MKVDSVALKIISLWDKISKMGTEFELEHSVYIEAFLTKSKEIEPEFIYG